MAKINQMNKAELISAIDYMAKELTVDPNFANWNFDPTDWQNTFNELIEAVVILNNKGEL